MGSGRQNGRGQRHAPPRPDGAVGMHHRAGPSGGARGIDHVGKPIYFGIRPEDIHDANYVPRGVSEDARVDVEIDVTEPLGSEVYAYVHKGGKEFIGRFDPRTNARTGDTLPIVLDMDKMHIFDRDTEQALR
ncbi:MAG: TOBE domain-containing protein [Chloroflexaceae bacterium]|nr:TOBE domain-containing protein [Chloroflexaceae bacterium]